jgi:adenylate cyclase
MRRRIDLASRIGHWPARQVTWGLALLFSLWIVLDVFVFELSAGLARPTYDAMVRSRLWAAPPDPRIVIVDIDEASLVRMAPEFGRWPWPRDTLASVLDHLERQGPAAIVWDIIFSDADRLNPGGDAAMDEAARRSRHSLYSLVRLPPTSDAASELSQAVLPGLWVSAGAGTATVALIAPVLPSMAAGPLGYNNGSPDDDGVLRRYHYTEKLHDGGVIQSIALAVLGTVDLTAARTVAQRADNPFFPNHSLVAWRRAAASYQRVPFWEVFAQAEGQPRRHDFAGKIVIIGATAPSLDDVHPTPLSAAHAGVDVLATVIDNALNRRQTAELPRGFQAAVAVALCLGLALWVQFKSVASLALLHWGLPAGLLGLSYVTLHAAPVFLDFNLAAGVGLVMVALLRFWNQMRRGYWCAPPAATRQPLSVWPWVRDDPWVDSAMDRLIDALERHAPDCRLMLPDAYRNWPIQPHWPELARFAAVIGPADAMAAARPMLEPALRRLAGRCLEPAVAPLRISRDDLTVLCFALWAELHQSHARPAEQRRVA